jgi:tetratricopeptide (TPR) repeat protein
LLKANKIAEAETEFRAVADEKAARIVQDKKDTAAAYRNLGAIAGLRDPKKALDAYEKAVEFDPDDVESLLWASYILVDRGNLDGAQTRLDRVLSLATANMPFYQYWARLGLGYIRVQRGDLAGALKSYRDGLAIAERLATSDPGNTGWQRDLSVSYDRVGDVQVAQGDLAGALKSYRDSLAIAERLATSDPGNVQWRNDLQYTIDQIGGLAYGFVLAGDFTNALDAADQVAAIARDQIWLHINRAHALMFLGRVDEARAVYLAHRGAKKVQGEISWETAVIEDFAELRAAKLTHPLMDEIEKRFAAPG